MSAVVGDDTVTIIVIMVTSSLSMLLLSKRCACAVPRDEINHVCVYYIVTAGYGILCRGMHRGTDQVIAL